MRWRTWYPSKIAKIVRLQCVLDAGKLTPVGSLISEQTPHESCPPR
ncbi:hypothetical protein RMSM_01672 [Rhodopirellula maiorica SM1]|uniref:Uncharacterized protein n=1 Tax=Rhodopirellula maiorica SM1 TaxID=1265738 RepID=M5RQ63_9BACT|nr:hypothetical protein RMSM_01672 [Rhodopirellula maiorica SM1]